MDRQNGGSTVSRLYDQTREHRGEGQEGSYFDQNDSVGGKGGVGIGNDEKDCENVKNEKILDRGSVAGEGRGFFGGFGGVNGDFGERGEFCAMDWGGLGRGDGLFCTENGLLEGGKRGFKGARTGGFGWGAGRGRGRGERGRGEINGELSVRSGESHLRSGHSRQRIDLKFPVLSADNNLDMRALETEDCWKAERALSKFTQRVGISTKNGKFLDLATHRRQGLKIRQVPTSFYSCAPGRAHYEQEFIKSKHPRGNSTNEYPPRPADNPSVFEKSKKLRYEHVNTYENLKNSSNNKGLKAKLQLRTKLYRSSYVDPKL